MHLSLGDLRRIIREEMEKGREEDAATEEIDPHVVSEPIEQQDLLTSPFARETPRRGIFQDY